MIQYNEQPHGCIVSEQEDECRQHVDMQRGGRSVLWLFRMLQRSERFNIQSRTFAQIFVLFDLEFIRHMRTEEKLNVSTEEEAVPRLSRNMDVMAAGCGGDGFYVWVIGEEQIYLFTGFLTIIEPYPITDIS